VVARKKQDVVNYELHDSDIETFTTKDSGPGGQHRNKTESCVVMRHLPTGIEAKSAKKCQHYNRTEARRLLEERVREHYESIRRCEEKAMCKDLAGSGMRGDKIKTYREKDNTVLVHSTNNKLVLKDVLKGKKI
jgi:peptide chain release factor 1